MPGKSQGRLQRSLSLPIEKGLVGWLNFNAELFLKSIGGDGGAERGRLYLTVTVTTIMTSIKMGSDGSHFTLSVILKDKVIRQCPQTKPFEASTAEAESIRGPSANQPDTLPLGQAGSHREIEHRTRWCM